MPLVQSILKCPFCPAEDSLRFGSGETTCSTCGRRFPVRNGVFVMYAPETEPEEPLRTWKEQEKTHHDAVAGHYETALAPKGENAVFIERSRAFRRLTRFLEKADGTVLDYGCGPGADTVDFLNRGRAVVAIDISEAMLRLTLQKASESRHPDRLTCVLADAEHLPFRQGSFGFVSSRGVLHHLPRVDLALAEIGRVLESGGKARIQEPSSRGSVHRERLLRLLARFPSLAPAPEPAAGATSPHDVGTENERPLSGPETFRLCRAAGLDGELFHWTDYFSVVAWLPTGISRGLAELLAALDSRRSSGDIFCILAEKVAGRG